eukprot:9761513-Heterocapsa_arctica.AAC.1
MQPLKPEIGRGGGGASNTCQRGPSASDAAMKRERVPILSHASSNGDLQTGLLLCGHAVPPSARDLSAFVL